jgi:hypothetical protein
MSQPQTKYSKSTVPENAFPELLGHAHLPEPGRVGIISDHPKGM